MSVQILISQRSPAFTSRCASGELAPCYSTLTQQVCGRQLNSWDGQPQANSSFLATIPSSSLPMSDPSTLPSALLQMSSTRTCPCHKLLYRVFLHASEAQAVTSAFACCGCRTCLRMCYGMCMQGKPAQTGW